MNMQAVKLDSHTLYKGLDSCQGDKQRKRSFISFLPLMQNLAVSDGSIYLKMTIRLTNRSKFQKKMNPIRTQHASGLQYEKV